MADLDSASLEDVKNWFRERYGPNNAVLVLAGDIDTATARTLVEKYFGDIPRGPENRPAQADVPTLPAPVAQQMKDRVATTRIYRNWIGPGLTAPDAVALDVAASVLGGLVAVRLGLPRVDALVSVLVAGAIGWSAWGILRGASRVLTDATIGSVEQVAAAACTVDGVAGCHQVRARGVGGMVRVDLHVTVDPQMTVARSHEIAEEVERRVRERVTGVAEVLVHVGPATHQDQGRSASE